MPQAFLERFYELVDDNLGDPHTSARLTKAKKLRDFYIAEIAIYERLLSSTGQESSMARAETIIELVDGQDYYPLPGGFRQFISFQKRLDSDPDRILGSLSTIGEFSPGPGILLLSEQQGMMVRPRPAAGDAGDWTLTYRKGPVLLHAATATHVGAKTLTAGTPAAGMGELVRVNDYYNNAMLMVYDAGSGAPQVREIVDFDGPSGTFTLRHAWAPMPTGVVKYEIRPILPWQYDSVYAVDVAVMNAGRRHNQRWMDLRSSQRDAIWPACMSYFSNNTSDRARTRGPLPSDSVADPYEHLG